MTAPVQSDAPAPGPGKVPPVEEKPPEIPAAPKRRSLSPTQMRLRRFRRLKRGYYSFLVLTGTYLLSFCLPFLMGDRAVAVRYEGEWYFPAIKSYWYDTFGFGREQIYLAEAFDQRNEEGLLLLGEADYRKLNEQFSAESGDNLVVLPPVPYSPTENLFDLPDRPPHAPSSEHWLGTDNAARDVLVRLAYGFRISISFALLVAGLAYAFGIMAGAVLGYYGRWVDMLGLRFVEIWGAIPFLYTVIIISSSYDLYSQDLDQAGLKPPKFIVLVTILAAFGWMAITYYVRGEYYREKAKDYVAAAIATGESNTTILFRHILPNALTPVITFAPFAIVAAIVSLVSLDFLGFGLQAPTPSWGELLNQAHHDLQEWHLAVFPLGAMFITLQLIVFIGEAVREAFDPKVYSRLR